MNKIRWVLLALAPLFVSGCGAVQKTFSTEVPGIYGMDAMIPYCGSNDTIRSILISRAEAVLTFDDQRYEVAITLYSKRDSIIYLSAVNSGFEIIRACVKEDSITVINRLEKIVYRAPLIVKYGYAYPVSFNDLQNLVANYYLCNFLEKAKDDHQKSIIFDFDEGFIKKRIILNRAGLSLSMFEFYHPKTDRYLMGERVDDSFKIYSNFMITDFEIVASGGNRDINKDIKVKMDVNPRKYSFTELR